jgi:hypothetical protein
MLRGKPEPSPRLLLSKRLPGRQPLYDPNSKKLDDRHARDDCRVPAARGEVAARLTPHVRISPWTSQSNRETCGR